MTKKFKSGGYETLEQVDEAIQDLKTNPKYENVADRQMKMFLKTLKEEKERLKNKPSLKDGGMVKKKPTKKKPTKKMSKKAGRLAMRGYGAARK